MEFVSKRSQCAFSICIAHSSCEYKIISKVHWMLTPHVWPSILNDVSDVFCVGLFPNHVSKSQMKSVSLSKALLFISQAYIPLVVRNAMSTIALRSRNLSPYRSFSEAWGGKAWISLWCITATTTDLEPLEKRKKILKHCMTIKTPLPKQTQNTNKTSLHSVQFIHYISKKVPNSSSTEIWFFW